jgi:hypothetical protein
LGDAVEEFRGGCGHVGAEAHFTTQYVRSAAGKDAQRHVRIHHPVQDLVDGAVPTGRDDQVRTGCNGFARNGRGRARTRRGQQFQAQTTVLEHVGGTLEKSTSIAL